MALSGESLARQVSFYGDKSEKQYSAAEISANNMALREWRKQYMNYWNSTAELTDIEKSVNDVIIAVALFAIALSLDYTYYEYFTFVNALDYISVVISVTTMDKSIDVVNHFYESLNKIDKII